MTGVSTKGGSAVLMVKVLCPQAGMTSVWANMTTKTTPPEYRCVKCGNTGHTKVADRGKGAIMSVFEDAKRPSKKKFKKGGKSKGKKKGGKETK